MFSVNGHLIIEDEQVILEELRRQLSLNGIIRFATFKQSGDDIMTNCPFHKNGQERKPSFGINKNNMSCHCFTCGWSGQLDDMISNVFGHDDMGVFGREWLSKNFLTLAVEDRKPLNLNLSRGNKIVTPNTSVAFTEEELQSYRWIHPYMYERGLTDEIIEEFDIGFDSNTQCITFPVYNIDKTPAFIARRSVRTKFFNYPSGAEKPIYCGERFVDGGYSYAVITESFLDALTGWKYGKPSMALIGTGSVNQYEILRRLPVRKYILATDNDNAGMLARQRLRRELSQAKIITEYIFPPGYKDFSDLQERILDLVETL